MAGRLFGGQLHLASGQTRRRRQTGGVETKTSKQEEVEKFVSSLFV